MTKPSEYRHISAWGRMLGSYQYYIDSQQAMASRDNAPIDAVYYDDRKWVTIGDCHENTQARILDLLA